jgi:phosphoribosylamine--glycine ligase
MKILVVGNGGREHALAWKIANDSERHEVYCAPGNAGTAEIATNVPISATDLNALLEWARENGPDLTVVGPEAPLCAGITDLFEAEGLRVFGPSKAAAQLEGSKIFAKQVMLDAGVPTARAAFFTDETEALAYAEELGAPLVVKADGLAAGKGVSVCTTMDEAREAIHSMLSEGVFGEAGARILIEECLEGEEASILALIDGEHIVMLASSQDHKRAYDGDKGPNTGGMGAYSPAPIVTDDLWPFIREQVFERTLAELKKRGITFKGVLYAGLMMTKEGPKVLEFNCRFGDPETQVVLIRLASDIVPAFDACVDGTLHDDLVRWKPEHAVCVVMASGGYPGTYEKGHEILGLDAVKDMDDAVVFHAGTDLRDGKVVTAGGRVLGVTAVASDLNTAMLEAYRAVSAIDFEGAFHREDIAWREMDRLRTTGSNEA